MTTIAARVVSISYQRFRPLLLSTLLTGILASSLDAQGIGVTVSIPDEPIPVGARIDDALQVQLVDSQGQPLSDRNRVLEVEGLKAIRFFTNGMVHKKVNAPASSKLGVGIDLTGQSPQTEVAVFAVRVWSAGTVQLEEVHTLSLTQVQVKATFVPSGLAAGQRHVDALKLQLVGDELSSSLPTELLKHSQFVIRAQGNGRLFTGATDAPRKTVTVDASDLGTAHVSLDLTALDSNSPPGPVILEVRAVRNNTPLTTDPLMVTVNVTTDLAENLRSDRVASELFLGSTFRFEYNEEGDSEGFGTADPVVRLNVDHMWGIDKPWKLHGSFRALTSSFASQLGEMEMPPMMPEDGMNGDDGMMEGDDMMEETPQDGEDDSEAVEFVDFYSGTLNLLWQPARLTRIKPTSRDSDRPFDATRLGFFTRAGFITRDSVDSNTDTSISFFNAGVAFTLNQTAAATKEHDNVNSFPVLFTEISGAYYEEFGNEDDRHWRLVVDAGFRLANTANGIAPFYVGLHLNAGEGVDDHRIYAGFLLQLDRLRQLVK
ncbi:MAG: hypothetical protein AAF604_19045 [Acidobacteriota bacterium]